MAEFKELLDGLQDLNPEEKAAKLEELLEQQVEEKKKLKSSSEKWAQKVLNQLKEEEKIRDTYLKLEENPEYIKELAKEDQNLAKKVLNHYYDWITLNDAIKKVWWQPIIDDDDVQTKVKQMFENEKVQKSIDKFKEWLSEDELQNFDKVYADNTDWIKISSKNIDRILKFVWSELNPDLNLKDLDKKAKIAASQASTWSRSVWWSTEKEVKEDVKLLLKKFKFN